MASRKLLLCLALSPIAFAICTIGFGLAFNNLLGTLAGDLAIILPLAFLVFGAGTANYAKRWLIVALGAFGLLAPAIVLYFVPTYAARIGLATSRIILEPPLHEMGTQGAAFLRGLSVKDGVLILRRQPDEGEEHTSPYSACDYLEWFYPPSHFRDENGNGMEFTLLAADTLHFRDDRGGYADVKWDGAHFQLVASHSAGQADSAKAAGRTALSLRTAGNLLLILSPLLAWLALTRFSWLQSQQAGTSTAALKVSGVLQAIGAMGFALAALEFKQSMDEVTGGIFMLVVVTSAAASLVGLVILGWKLVGTRRKFEVEGQRLDVRG